MNLVEHIPALGMETDAVLTQFDTLLDDEVLFQAMKADLATRFPRTSSRYERLFDLTEQVVQQAQQVQQHLPGFIAF
ncbi:MAG: hypothetical protein ACUVS4_08530 [Chloroflexaceae bacterium]